MLRSLKRNGKKKSFQGKEEKGKKKNKLKVGNGDPHLVLLLLFFFSHALPWRSGSHGAHCFT